MGCKRSRVSHRHRRCATTIPGGPTVSSRNAIQRDKGWCFYVFHDASLGGPLQGLAADEHCHLGGGPRARRYFGMDVIRPRRMHRHLAGSKSVLAGLGTSGSHHGELREIGALEDLEIGFLYPARLVEVRVADYVPAGDIPDSQ
jgi:hypothetical protein